MPETRRFQRAGRVQRALRAPDKKVHTFITSWPKVADNAELLRQQLNPYGNVTMLNNPNHYFTEQWNSMLDQFVGDTMLWVMGDITLPVNLSELHTAIQSVMHLPNVGIYGPDINYTFHHWDTTDFRQLLAGVYVVPCAEANFWALDRKVVKAMHHVNPLINYIGWGIDLQASATAEMLGLDTVRDYRFLVKHPKGTNYNSIKAEEEMLTWVDQLMPSLREVMERRWTEGLKYNLTCKDSEGK